MTASDLDDLGLATDLIDEIDFEDSVRIAIEEKSSFLRYDRRE